MARGALPGRKPATRVRRERRADRLADGAVEPLGRELDLEEDGALGGGRGGDLHRRASIGRRAVGRGVAIGCRAAAADRRPGW